jgi:hypothetical protein
MDIDSNIARFLEEFTKYIGEEYLAAKSLTIDLDTRFDQLNFDLVDEVITEHMIKQIFNLDNWKQDAWPETIRSLINLTETANAD